MAYEIHILISEMLELLKSSNSVKGKLIRFVRIKIFLLNMPAIQVDTPIVTVF